MRFVSSSPLSAIDRSTSCEGHRLGGASVGFSPERDLSLAPVKRKGMGDAQPKPSGRPKPAGQHPLRVVVWTRITSLGHENMNLRQIKSASRAVHRLISEYSTDPAKKREMRHDPLLLGYFAARFGKMSRQKRIHIGDGSHPKRVDFRHGGPNPVLIEFAVRPPNGLSELYGSQNRGELNKLTRFPSSEARLRVLLLFDFAPTAIRRDDLKATYDPVRSSPGKFSRFPVQVIYTHESITYGFIWKP